MKPYFIYLFYYFLIYLFNIITINFTITGRKKGGKTVKNKQTKKAKYESFNRLTTTGRTNRKIIIARVC